MAVVAAAMSLPTWIRQARAMLDCEISPGRVTDGLWTVDAGSDGTQYVRRWRIVVAAGDSDVLTADTPAGPPSPDRTPPAAGRSRR
jgi:hypothetical protein